MKHTSQNRASRAAGARSSWASWLVAATAWLLHLLLSYGVVEWHCQNRPALSDVTATGVLHLLTGVCALAALWGAWVAYRNLRRLTPFHDQKPRSPQQKTEYERSRFMSKAGIAISLFFAVVIIVQGLPNLLLEPCS